MSYEITQLAQATPAPADLIPFVDVDDTSTPPANGAGSNKAATLVNLLAGGLDGTASDIQAAGAQAAGAVGKPADAGHVHPSAAGGYSRMGSVIGWTSPPAFATTTYQPTAGNAGTLLMWLTEIPVAATTAAFNMFVTTAGNTLANVFAALVSTSGTIVASTANRAADAALTTNNSLWSPPWSSSYAAPAGEYYACLLIGSATTMPVFAGGRGTLAAMSNIGCSAGAVTLRGAAYSSGLSGLPGSVTMGSMVSYGGTPWVCLT